jgi:hypothetical protein
MNDVNIAGKKIGKLTAIRPTDRREYGSIVWECICECGNATFLSTKDFNRGLIQSCGCYKTPDLTALRFKSLTVVKKAKLSGVDDSLWECKCSCGGKTIVSTADLLESNVKNCGCIKRRNDARKFEKLESIIRQIESDVNSNPEPHETTNPECCEVLGVCYVKSSGKWIAYITIKGKHHYLGKYPSRSEAIRARKEAEFKNLSMDLGSKQGLRWVAYKIFEPYNQLRFRLVTEKQFERPIAHHPILRKKYQYINYNKNLKKYNCSISIAGNVYVLGTYTKKIAAIKAQKTIREAYQNICSNTRPQLVFE